MEAYCRRYIVTIIDDRVPIGCRYRYWCGSTAEGTCPARLLWISMTAIYWRPRLTWWLRLCSTDWARSVHCTWRPSCQRTAMTRLVTWACGTRRWQSGGSKRTRRLLVPTRRRSRCSANRLAVDRYGQHIHA